MLNICLKRYFRTNIENDILVPQIKPGHRHLQQPFPVYKLFLITSTYQVE